MGLHIAEQALKKGHELTLFNRGKTNPDVFPEVEKILGNRDGQMDNLKNREWDAVIDTCGYYPRVVKYGVDLLMPKTKHYVFISSISVYANFDRKGLKETDPLGKIEDESVEEITGTTYGPLKALCENAVLEAAPEKALIIRPGFIVGPNDPSDRFTYWPWRIHLGGEVLAPGDPENPASQIIDVRDLADWILHLVDRQVLGIFNATGPDKPRNMKQFLQLCQKGTGSEASFNWISDTFLFNRGVKPFMDLPLWIPNDGNYEALHSADIQKALDQGLTFRPLELTARDTVEWKKNTGPDIRMRVGMTMETEAQIIKSWKEINRDSQAGSPHEV